MSSSQDLHSIYGLVNTGSGKDEGKLLYRTLIGPKGLPKAVTELETLEYLIDCVPTDLQDIILGAKRICDKALISTTSINGRMMDMLLTTKQRIEVSDPRAKRGIVGKLMPNNNREPPM